ncbi:MAG: hypothetical protein Q8N96_01680 [Methylovulum sp.]|nr:hypothetical protein [Methylovulum sp.]
MFLASRTFLVIFLALLQLIAPLVHAHTDKPFFAMPNHETGRLHIPGLEAYQRSDDGLGSSETLQYCAVRLDAPSEGIVFGVGAGIKPSQDNGLTDADHYYLPPQPIIFAVQIALMDSCGTCFPPRLLPCHLFSPYSPRAPPVQCSVCSK